MHLYKLLFCGYLLRIFVIINVIIIPSQGPLEVFGTLGDYGVDVLAVRMIVLYRFRRSSHILNIGSTVSGSLQTTADVISDYDVWAHLQCVFILLLCLGVLHAEFSQAEVGLLQHEVSVRRLPDRAWHVHQPVTIQQNQQKQAPCVAGGDTNHLQALTVQS